METMLLLVIVVGVIANLIILIFKKSSVQVDSSRLESAFKAEVDRIATNQNTINSNNRTELINLFGTLKTELNQGLLDNRTELSASFKNLRAANDDKLAEFSTLLAKISEGIVAKQDSIRKETEAKLSTMQESISKSIALLNEQIKAELKSFGSIQTANSEQSIKKLDEIRRETETKLNEYSLQMNKAIESLTESLSRKFGEFSETQKRSSEEYIRKHDEIKKSTDQKLESIRETVQQRLELLQESNSKKLDEMRLTVDEKLQKTINSRITEAFKQVSDQLESVNKGLGEMTALASDVGGLKKVLTNVKTRGIIGEIQLGGILESILTPDQYEMNAAVVKGSQERVEYAIKLPGKDEDDTMIYLPIDSKFPDAAYQKLLDAYNEAEPKKITLARKELENAIRTSAKDIHNKYINPPETTDFAIMFLPFEGLYAEVLQNTNLVHSLQIDLQICIAGPTTLGAFINSLQMGFRTLQVQKRSSEVWKLLGAVKQQFQLFGNVLDSAQKKIRGAGDDIEKLVGTRTRMIQSKLKNIPVLDGSESDSILEIESDSPSEI
ncbi:MAG: DNA recombination protein RmuC [Candidatus Cloacimonadota bacterium]